MSEKEQKIEFPTTWSYRIIVDAANKDCRAAILDLLKEYGIKAQLLKTFSEVMNLAVDVHFYYGKESEKEEFNKVG